MQRAKTARPDSARAEANRARALDLRIKGGSYRTIAATLGVALSTAYQYVVDGLDGLHKINEEKAERLRDLEALRYDSMIVKLWGRRQDPRTADTILRVSKARRELLGLDAPTRYEFSPLGNRAAEDPNVELTDEEREAQMRDMIAGIAARGRGGHNGDGNGNGNGHP